MSLESLNAVQSQQLENNACVWNSATIAELTLVEQDNCQGNVLPSAEDYQQQDMNYVTGYWELQSRKWSEPKYRCPVCNEGGMRRDETVVLTSNPPSYRYECDKCHHVTYHHI
jgi:predicted RNA-binding Zn-ribbon protein involved in translation (DUF1610 family)